MTTFRRNLLLIGAVWPAVTILVCSAQSTVSAATLATGAAKAEDRTLAFEVASIRQDKGDRPAQPGALQVAFTPDGWHMMNSPLAVAILIAYVPQSGSAAFYQNNDVVGLPNWVKDDRYDIDAKVGEAERVEWQKPGPQAAMLRTMMQTLLAERCKLAVHRDPKEIPVYSLVIGKNGPNFKPTNPDDPHPAGQALPGGGVVAPEATGLHFYGAPVNILASVLSSSAGRPVQDKTGLTGRYDFLLQRPASSGASAPMDGAASDPVRSIFSVAEELGLKLEPAKGSVETLVVDHIERPSEN
jgi:uncharacterized protein (TIGR03435 family)